MSSVSRMNPSSQRNKKPSEEGSSSSSSLSIRRRNNNHRSTTSNRTTTIVSQRMVRKTVSRLNNPSKKEAARLAAYQAAELAWQSLRRSLSHPYSSSSGTNLNTDDVYTTITPSVFTETSKERAIQKRRRRGSSEINESPIHNNNNNHTTDFDLMTIEETSTIRNDTSLMDNAGFTQPRQRHRRRSIMQWRILPIRKWSHSSPSLASAASEHSYTTMTSHKKTNTPQLEAWMCGVCGMAFATENSAEKHEQQHILDVVQGLGFDTKQHHPTTTKMNPPSNPHVPYHPYNNNNNNSGTFHLNSATPHPQPQPQPPDHHHHHHHVQFMEEKEMEQEDHKKKTPKRTNITSASHPEIPKDNYSDSNLQNPFPSPPKADITQEGWKHGGVEDYPGLDADLIPSPEETIAVQTTGASNTKQQLQLRFSDPLLGGPEYASTSMVEDALLLSSDMKDYLFLADEALLDVISRAQPMILNRREVAAERELALLARDKAYYDELHQRAAARRVDPSNRFRSDADDLLGKVQNRLLDAYQLMKDPEGRKGLTDQYNRKMKSTEESTSIEQTANTLYVNVMVKNSVQVVRHELERLARQRWEMAEEAEKFTRFERFRMLTQTNMVKLAGLALASDFTPRRIAVQLSNDLYRLLTPRLKRRGVTIETEIEYRVGPYFVLAVNVITVDWQKLIKATHKDVIIRNARWQKDREGEAEKIGSFRQKLASFIALLDLSVNDAIAQSLSILYNFHWIIYLPICFIANLLIGARIRHFIIASVTDEIFFYIEEKGMEMEIKLCRTETQAAFMLSALRQIRAEGQELKKKREETETLAKEVLLGPLMGPAILSDKGPAPTIPDGFEIPTNLEFIGLELELPVGFKRLRWALLSTKSEFLTEALYKTEARYDNVVCGKWNKHDEAIGEPKPPEGVAESDFIGAEREAEYLMPKSAFVSANMCYETQCIVAYNDYCFCLKKKARNPDAPFGKTFVAWTQYLVVNTGNNTCKMTCSVEAEFPNGEPMMSRQIRSGMRAGVGEVFVLTGATITKYAHEFP